MAWEIATLTKSGGDDVHYKMMEAIRVLAIANGWTVLRNVNTGADRELIMSATGLSGTEQIFVGFKSYQNVASDYYNLAAATMVGYVSGNTFETQPGIQISGVPAHNNALTYFMIINAQRIAFCMKVGTPVYEHCYVGKYFPYARPSEYPSPLINAGMLNGAATTRFSDTTHSMPYKGSGVPNYIRMRDPTSVWGFVDVWPWQNTIEMGGVGDANNRRYNAPLDVYYRPLPAVINNANGVYGNLDGIYYISGYNNAVENVLQVGGSLVDQTGMSVAVAVAAIIAAGGRAFVVLQDVYRTSFRDFIAMEML